MALPRCQICQTEMDFFVISHRNQPFIDGKCYSRMCFCCFKVPQESIQTYKPDGSLDEEFGPFYDHLHLCSPEELVEMQSAESLAEAKRSVRAVKEKLKDVGAVALKKLRLTRPKGEYDFAD